MTTHATIHHFRARRNPSREIACHRLRSRRGNGIVEEGALLHNAGPATCPYRHPPRVSVTRASSSTFMRLILPFTPPRFGPSPWAGIRWSRVPGHAPHRPGLPTVGKECPLSAISLCLALPIASTQSGSPVMTPTPVVSVVVLFWTVAVPSWHSGPMLRNATDALFHVLHPAAITLTAAHTCPPSPRPSAATCEHEQLSVMARQRPPCSTRSLSKATQRGVASPHRFQPSSGPAATRKRAD